jgi:uncharacterized membrane protein YsdA (DUF1294 family)
VLNLIVIKLFLMKQERLKKEKKAVRYLEDRLKAMALVGESEGNEGLKIFHEEIRKELDKFRSQKLDQQVS